MTKNEIVVKIADELNMLQLQVKEVVQKTFDEIIDVLANEGRLELRNFGVFEVRKRKARKARNPRTGEGVFIDDHKVVVFHAGKIMEDRVQGKMKTRKLAEDGSIPADDAAPAAAPAPEAPAPAAAAADAPQDKPEA